MHIDAGVLENGSVVEGDICIIGAGASGISIALQWINAGHKVILLEGGGFKVEPEMQDLYKGKTTGQRYYPLQSARLHYFGGTTGHWAGFCSVLDPIDFKKREWVPHSGWPIKREDLDSYYERAHKILELGPYNYDFDHWNQHDPSLASLPIDENIIYNKLWQFSPPTRFGTKYKDVIVNAKNVHLYTHANVTSINVDENGKHVKEVTIKNLEGKEHTVKARHFVMACCSIQNARLLLASNRRVAKGLGNDNDLVGRYFMEHLEINSADLFLASASTLKLYMWEYFTVKMRAELAVTEKKQEELKILNGTASFDPYLGKEPAAFIDTFSDRAEVQVKAWEEKEKQFNSASKPDAELQSYKHFKLFTRMEQAPNPASRVTLDTDRDALGVPRAILNWELTTLEKKSIHKLFELIGHQMGIGGVGRVKLMDWLEDAEANTWPSTVGGGWHHMGTTRMHENPREGVVDADCKIHGIDNLFVAGASCFTTAGAANPTLTLVALSLRLSDHLKNKLGIRP